MCKILFLKFFTLNNTAPLSYSFWSGCQIWLPFFFPLKLLNMTWTMIRFPLKKWSDKVSLPYFLVLSVMMWPSSKMHYSRKNIHSIVLKLSMLKQSFIKNLKTLNFDDFSILSSNNLHCIKIVYYCIWILCFMLSNKKKLQNVEVVKTLFQMLSILLVLPQK